MSEECHAADGYGCDLDAIGSIPVVGTLPPQPPLPPPELGIHALLAECWDLWDRDQEMRLGKMLKALCGRLPGYRSDIDRALAELRQLQNA